MFEDFLGVLGARCQEPETDMYVYCYFTDS